MPLRRECQAEVEEKGSGMELRASCDLSQAMSSEEGETGSEDLVVPAAEGGQDREVEGGGEREGRRRKRSRAAAAVRRRTEAGTVMRLDG